MLIEYTASEDGRTVYNVLKREFGVSTKLVRRLRQTEAIFVNGIPVYTIFELHQGDRLCVDIEKVEPECETVLQSGDVDILREDEGLIWVNKPAGVLVHPSASKYTDTLLNYLCGLRQQRDGVPWAHAVNRLDRDTSGVVLYAKNSYMKDRASVALREPAAEKEYLALCYGIPSPLSGTVDTPIRRIAEHDMERIVAPDGQAAITHYETVRTYPEGFSLLRLQLETGRTHQIRVHMKHIGCPLLGDALYGNSDCLRLSETLQITTQALHARSLSFIHPMTKEAVTVSAPILRPELRKYMEV